MACNAGVSDTNVRVQSVNAMVGPTDLDHKRGFAAAAILTGLLSLVLVFATAQAPPKPGTYLQSFSQHRGAYIAVAVLLVTWAVIAIPFVVSVGQTLRARGAVLASAGVLLSAVGIALLGFGSFASIGAFMALSAAGGPPAPGEAEYQATIWWNLSFFLSDPALMTWGLGFLLFGKLAWRSGILPNWLAVLGLIGGLAGLLTLAVYRTPMLALLQVMCFAVWAITVGVKLLKK